MGERFALQAREWLSVGECDPLLDVTTGWLEIGVSGVCLTRHEDLWSRTVRDAVLVSAWPLALWLVEHWWRLHYEPLPASIPSFEWQVAHELGAADHGYCWPRVLLVSDGEAMQVWAERIDSPGQSVRYLVGLEAGPQRVPLSCFQESVDQFLRTVIDRLDAFGHRQTQLHRLWQTICQERLDPDRQRDRRWEARFGFDRGRAPKELLVQLKALQTVIGEAAIEELAPAYGKAAGVEPIVELQHVPGIRFNPQVPWKRAEGGVPWQQGVSAARALRAHLGNCDGPIDDATLHGLLGLSQKPQWVGVTNRPVTVVRSEKCGFALVPRKRHPIARRFELARVLGDWVTTPESAGGRRVSSDVGTARQKRQRAFAAEFLCPIEALTAFFPEGQFTDDDAMEEAKHHFGVSDLTLQAQLANNGYLPRFEGTLPYRLSGT